MKRRKVDHMKVPSFCDDEPDPDARWPILDTFAHDGRPYTKDDHMMAEHAKNMALLDHYQGHKAKGEHWYPIQYDNGAVQYVPVDRMIEVVQRTLTALTEAMH